MSNEKIVYKIVQSENLKCCCIMLWSYLLFSREMKRLDLRKSQDNKSEFFLEKDNLLKR